MKTILKISKQLSASQTRKMDVNFIKLVNDHNFLWNPNNDLQRNAWQCQNISEEMEGTVDELKKKWLGLRDTFGKKPRKELMKVNSKKSGHENATGRHSKWLHFKRLLFFRNKKPRKETKGHVHAPETRVIYDGEDSANRKININSNSPPPPSSDHFSDSSEDEIPRTILKSSLGQRSQEHPSLERDTRLLQIEEDKINNLKQSTNDPDTQFLLSLLPFLKDTPRHRKLIVLVKLLQVFIDEEQMISTDNTKIIFYDNANDKV